MNALRNQIVYFAQRSGGPIKIGTSAQIGRRIRNLEGASGESIEVLATVPGDEELERHLHEKFADIRISGEWFRPERELVDFVASIKRLGRGALPAGLQAVKPPLIVKVDEEAALEAARDVFAIAGGKYPAGGKPTLPVIIADVSRKTGVSQSKLRSYWYRQTATLSYAEMKAMMMLAIERADTSDDLYKIYDELEPLFTALAHGLRKRLGRLEGA